MFLWKLLLWFKGQMKLGPRERTLLLSPWVRPLTQKSVPGALPLLSLFLLSTDLSGVSARGFLIKERRIVFLMKTPWVEVMRECAWKVGNKIPKSILNCTGSWWREAKFGGDICCVLLVLVMNLAAVSWTNCTVDGFCQVLGRVRNCSYHSMMK